MRASDENESRKSSCLLMITGRSESKVESADSGHFSNFVLPNKVSCDLETGLDLMSYKHIRSKQANIRSASTAHLVSNTKIRNGGVGVEEKRDKCFGTDWESSKKSTTRLRTGTVEGGREFTFSFLQDCLYTSKKPFGNKLQKWLCFHQPTPIVL